MRYMITEKYDYFSVLWTEDHKPNKNEIEDILDQGYNVDDVILLKIEDEFTIRYNDFEFSKIGDQ